MTIRKRRKAVDRSSRRIDIQKEIDLHIVSEGPTKGWVHTHGMAKFGKPELEMRNVPLFLAHAASSLMNAVCDYILNEGAVIKTGENVSLGGMCVVRIEELPLLDETHPGPRWTLTDAPNEGRCSDPECKENHND